MANLNLLEDESRRKVIEYKNNKFIAEAKDPYGLWEIHLERGTLPEKLKGTYTEFVYALRQINNYVNSTEPKGVATKEA